MFIKKWFNAAKYFLSKIQILVVDELYYSQFGWRTWVNKTWKNIDINIIKTKLWITDHLVVYRGDVSNNSIVSSIIPKIYQCDATYLIFCYQVISLNEFMLLCSSAKVLTLRKVTVKNDDGTEVSFEKLFEQLPQLKEIEITFTTPSNNTPKKTFKEFWEIPQLSIYDNFCLCDIPEIFDINSFYSFMKKNKNAKIFLSFSDEISEECKTRLEAIIDEITETENHEYKVPFIRFPGIDEKRFNKLFNIFCR
uniref:Uncharacterized protein n=1 Tax=Panagrolaimus superbus TaxID=310955 RepID=A0A914ZGX1_9BILA